MRRNTDIAETVYSITYTLVVFSLDVTLMSMQEGANRINLVNFFLIL